ncbi:hypothetical protein [Jannaschia pohangensis]|uniref:Uncharacterized protein n=1 Tax=Jannaschia pohangensis TaxID=390807 RepID=A0A1I3MP14_9RHOB|nr:hypothetical protein [Jannaschia pohangensis]SFI98455.1 hypothetical protein SAMN04488095_1905 [Jannaschia pohangensis]
MIRPLFLAALLAAPIAAQAQDFAAGSEAKTWNLYAEEPARFTARVTDPLCELTGDCAADCGAGSRQLVLIREADDAMIFPLKNKQPAFTGAVNELAPFCQQVIEVDGLMLNDPDIGAVNVYLVQRLKPEGGDWRNADQWTKDWAEANPNALRPDGEAKGPWFRRDPRIRSEIEAEGYLGLGLEVDGPFIADWF